MHWDQEDKTTWLYSGDGHSHLRVVEQWVMTLSCCWVRNLHPSIWLAVTGSPAPLKADEETCWWLWWRNLSVCVIAIVISISSCCQRETVASCGNSTAAERSNGHTGVCLRCKVCKLNGTHLTSLLKSSEFHASC